MPPRSSIVGWNLALTSACGLLLLGCAADVPLGDTNQAGLTSTAPNRGAAAVTSGTFSGTLGITDPFTASGTLTGPDYGPYETLVDVTVSGLDSAIRNTVFPSSPPVPVGGVDAVYDARPIGGCQLGAGLRYPAMFGSVLVPVPPNLTCSPHPVQTTYIFLTTLRGTGQIERFPTTAVLWLGVPIDRYEGDLSVKMYRPAAQLVVQPDRWVVQAGSGPVVFRARRTPDRYQNAVLPFQVISWKWTPDGGSPVPVVCDTVCSYSPSVSGSMEVTAAVNGEVQTKTIRIPVNPCPVTGDSIDNPDVRSRMEADLAASNPGGGPFEHEVSGVWIYNDATGEPQYVPPLFSAPTPCSDHATFAPPPPGWHFGLPTHTHPRQPRTPHCRPGMNVGEGPSRPNDYDILAQFHVPRACVIQYRGAGQPPSMICYPADPSTPYKKYLKQPDGCYKPKP